ncbi:hypothetical protein LAX5112_02199 [Roseibium alexandrii]|uniref:Uncharacterized protein n=2 Tax=Roseibium alexandrii TaxID=388408 RepID=A0A0M7A7Q3_9HYPH|nr:hypothetical protein LAX5112_02199 [Roseibium alexandrii]
MGMDNLMELKEFRDYWRNSEDYKRENYGNDTVEYDVIAVYDFGKSPGKIVFNSLMKVCLQPGFNDGRVDLDEAPHASVEDYHLTFYPKFQEYEFDQNTGDFIITGASDKMGGDYVVTISPAMQKP